MKDDHHYDAQYWSHVLGRACEAMGIAITITDPFRPDNPIVYANAAFEHLTGYSAEEAIGRNCRFLQGYDRDQPSLEVVRAAIREEQKCRVLLRNYRKEGALFWQDLRISPMRDEQDRLTHFVGVHADVTERKLEQDRLAHEAWHDSLTDLPNRSLFLDRLQHALARIERHGGRLAVLFMDLDDFKSINDSLGHEAGDRLIVSVGERLSSHLREEDTLARLAGDEFAVVLEGSTRNEAVRFAERIAQVLRDPFVLDGQEVFVRACIGIALGGAATNTEALELLRRADLAMYRAKRSAEAHYAVYEEEMKAEALRRVQTRARLEQAVEREEFVVHYQPQVELASGKALLMEALVRWKHPHRGLLRPESFLPTAEQTGFIVPIGRLVLREACHQAKGWQELYPPGESPVGVSVNVSARQLEHPDLVEDVARILRDTGLDPSGLVLEISEGVEKTLMVVQVLEELKALGVGLAIDDFGTGHSSIAYLENFPADYLKLDVSLAGQLTPKARSWKFILGTITLARFLGYKTIAEGVETVEQLERLRRCKSDLVQGFYFGEPLPREEALAIVVKYLL